MWISFCLSLGERDAEEVGQGGYKEEIGLLDGEGVALVCLLLQL